MDEIRVKITLYKEILCIETIKPDEDKYFVPVGNGRIGCVLIGTDKRLGISKEALEWLKEIPKSHDDIGDVDCWISVRGWCFGWLGGLCSIKNKGITGSRSYTIESLPHITVDNDVPEEAIGFINDYDTPST